MKISCRETVRTRAMVGWLDAELKRTSIEICGGALGKWRFICLDMFRLGFIYFTTRERISGNYIFIPPH